MSKLRTSRQKSSINFLLILFQFMSPHWMRNYLRKLKVVHPDIQTIGIPLQYEEFFLFGAREEKTSTSSLKCHSLAEDIKLSAHRSHPTSYPFYFFVCLCYFILFCSCFCFPLLFQCFIFQEQVCLHSSLGLCYEPCCSQQFHPSSRYDLSMLYTHWGQCVI